MSLYPTSEDLSRFSKLKRVFLDDGRGHVRQLTVERARMNGKLFLIKFQGLDRIEDVERMRGNSLLVSREDAIPLSEGEYYAADIIGLTVLDESDGHVLGRVTDVYPTGANDVYEMVPTDQQGEPMPGADSVLLPAIRECVRDIDMDRRTMTVHLMPGLMD